MGNHISIKKWTGSSSGLVEYLKEEGLSDSVADAASAFLSYHNASSDSIVFDHVRSSGSYPLDGLDLSRGLTKAQYEDVFSGTWGGEQHTSGGYAKVWELDVKGYEKWIDDPDGTGKRTRIPVMEEAKTRAGNPRLDDNGNPVLKQKMEYRHVAGYDVPISLSKDRCEFLIKRPDLYPKYVEFMQKSSDVVMGLIQDYVPLVKENLGPSSTNKSQGSATRMVKADGILWSSVVQCGSRPTKESDARLGGQGVVDPHLHSHNFIYAMARHGEDWKQIDGQELFRNTEWLSAAFENEMSRLEAEAGIQIEFLPPTRKGLIHSQIKGTNPFIRKFLSTNSDRAWKVKMAFEKKYGRTPSRPEYEREMQKTKGSKTKGAKEADLGGEPYWSKVKSAIETENIKRKAEWEEHRREVKKKTGTILPYECPNHLDLTISNIDTTPRPPLTDAEYFVNVTTLYDRLEAPDGLVRDCDEDPIFGPEVLIPTAFRASVGLGFTAEEIKSIVDTYRLTELVKVRDAADVENQLFTTKTVLNTQKLNAKWLQNLSERKVKAVSEETLISLIEKYELDPDQQKAFRLACGTDALTYVIGYAGTGKSLLLQAIAEAWRTDELIRDLAATTTAAKAGLAIGREVNAEHTGSIASIEKQVGKRKWVPSSLDGMFLEEAGLVGTFDLAQLRRAAERVGRVVVVLDDHQLQAIGPSGWQENELKIRPVAKLTQVYRQNEEADREAFLQIRDGHAHAALGDLHSRGRVHVTDSSEEMFTLFTERYSLHRSSGREVEDIVVYHQGSNKEGLDVYNRFVQRYRYEAHERGEDDRFDPEQFFKMSESSSERRWTLFAGDRGIFTRSLFDKVAEPVRNGSGFEVLRISKDGEARIKLDDNRVLTIQLKAEMENQFVQPGYCISTTKGQGSKAKVAMVVPGNPGTANLNSLYTQVTRAVEHVDILLDKATWGDNPIVNLGRACMQLHRKRVAAQVLSGLVYSEHNKEHVTWDIYEENGTVFAEEVDEIIEENDQVTQTTVAQSNLRAMRSSLRGTDDDSERKKSRQPMGIGLSI